MRQVNKEREATEGAEAWPSRVPDQHEAGEDHMIFSWELGMTTMSKDQTG